MYGYNKYIPLNPEEIFKRVSQEEIFKIVIPGEILPDKEAYYHAPYREDNDPGCYFRYHEQKLYFIDFAESDFKLDCIDLIRKVFHLSYMEALQFINQTLNLGLGGTGGGIKEIKKHIEPKEVHVKKRVPTTIQILVRNFDVRDKNYWTPYGITKSNLIQDKVFPISLYRLKKDYTVIIRPFDIMYAYTDFQNERKKIYRPLSPQKKDKWVTNCNQDDVGGIQSLIERDEILIITKSYKDYRVLKNQHLNVIWFQNEGMIPNTTILQNLHERFSRIYVWFDNDRTGIASGKIVADKINTLGIEKARQIYLAPSLLLEGIKDPSDLIKLKGKVILETFISDKVI